MIEGDYSKETAEIGGAFDAAALKEAVKTQTESSFQSYMGLADVSIHGAKTSASIGAIKKYLKAL